ncbi:AraC family transcriptional regulator [Polaribacter cellanae]|uniref:Helix-turn-helix transcriptional regulator n=1 Tax=Polaribacter cellanae TaxID=2818493 RepID=A0A975CN05_9FLAO|nr:AraC family transcriptional regulator [Polaribacter cellanae]QTE22608.1 helix-turn-helix transcriptional regulator [Polaribacter cellanae]
MDKKRRKKNKWKASHIIKENGCLEELIGTISNKIHNKENALKEYSISPSYGKGTISIYTFNDIWLSISNFKLHNDLLLTYEKQYNSLQLVFLLDGEKIITLNGANKDIVCENQQCYMAKIYDVNGNTRISGGKLYKEIKIRLSPIFLKKMGIENQLTFKDLTDTKLIRPITNELSKVLRELEDYKLQGINHRLFFNAKVLELLVFQIENYKSSKPTKALNGNTEVIKHLYGIRQYIIDNIHKNYTIKELSLKVGLNEFVLKKEFKRIFGYSVNQFSRKEKMRFAQNLLKTTQIPIYEIAEKIGYKNATHFSVAFKKYTGITPKKFRMRL